MGVTFSALVAKISLPPLIIMLSYSVALGTDTQSVTADRDTRCSDGLD